MDAGVGAGVSEFFYYVSKYKIKKYFWEGRRAGRGMGARICDFFTKDPNLKKN